MGVWYQMTGQVHVNNTPEVIEIVNRFNERTCYMGISWNGNDDDDTLLLDFYGGDYMSHGSTEELEKITQELCPFVITPAFIEYMYENDSGQMYIGEESDREAVESSETLRDIIKLIPYINDRDKAALVRYLAD